MPSETAPPAPFADLAARRLFAIEGVDGAGKSTQVAELGRWLSSKAGANDVPFTGVTVLHEPTDGPIGMELRALARQGREVLTPQREFELFLDDRRWDVERRIGPALERGELVLMDRYYLSSVAYQGALGLDPQGILEANERVAPRPARTLVLELPVEESLRRIRARKAAGGEEVSLFERGEYLRRVADLFAQAWVPGIVRINAAQSMDRVQHAMRAALSEALGLSEA